MQSYKQTREISRKPAVPLVAANQPAMCLTKPMCSQSKLSEPTVERQCQSKDNVTDTHCKRGQFIVSWCWAIVGWWSQASLHIQHHHHLRHSTISSQTAKGLRSSQFWATLTSSASAWDCETTGSQELFSSMFMFPLIFWRGTEKECCEWKETS